MSRQVQVKNRAPAPIQITAEQILREANDRIEKEVKAPRTHITDPEELMQVREQACGLVYTIWGHPHECCVPASSVYTSGRSMRTRSAVSDNILGTTSSMRRGRRVRMSSKEPVPFSSGKPHPPRQPSHVFRTLIMHDRYQGLSAYSCRFDMTERSMWSTATPPSGFAMRRWR